MDSKDVSYLNEVIRRFTKEFRKGPSVQSQQSGAVTVVNVWMMPSADKIPADCKAVDVHFIAVAVNTNMSRVDQKTLYETLLTYPRFSQGPSYIEIGGVLGDQGLALRLFALGEALGFWTVVTPATLGMEGVTADEMAGLGLVMIDGLREFDFQTS